MVSLFLELTCQFLSAFGSRFNPNDRAVIIRAKPKSPNLTGAPIIDLIIRLLEDASQKTKLHVQAKMTAIYA